MKYIGNIIAILVVVVIFLALLQLKKDENFNAFLDRIKLYFSELFRITKHNIKMEVSPKWKPKKLSIETESALINNFPEIFLDFTQKDWENFWKIIYQPKKEKQGWFEVMRYRTKEEIEEALKKNYPQFEDFSEKKWRFFWEECLRILWKEED